MKHYLHWCIWTALAFLLFGSPTLYAQYSSQAAQAKKLSELYDQRGYLNGQSITVDGSLSVSDANGTPSYTYPISSFTSNGHPLNVTLNYAGSVAFTTYHRYYEYSVNNSSESWSKYHKNEPAWLLGVNGFAVQALAFTTSFVNDPYYMTIGYSDNHIEYTDKSFVWTIDGYDVCNRMSELEPPSDNRHDVIRLLRTDGSILELHNILSYNDLSSPNKNSRNPDLYRGHYYQNEANPSVYGKVEFDSTYIPTGSTISDPSRLPRILHYYPGDGLEYVFREFCLPFGKETYTAYWTNGGTGEAIYGAIKAPPTIFYLTQINDETENVLSFEYSRHKPEEQMFFHPDSSDQDVSRGRALCTGFTGHTLVYNNNALSIQALGRTTNIRFGTANGGSVYQDVAALDTTTASPIIEYGLDGAPAPTLDSSVSSQKHNCWKGYITSITDPEGRETRFTYERYKRTFQTIGFPHQFVAGQQRPVKLAFWRMSKVFEPSAEQRISYQGAIDTTLTADGGFMSPNTPQIKQALKYALNATVKNVKKYDRQGVLLSTQTFDMNYDGSIPSPSSLDFPQAQYRDGWVSTTNQTDNITGFTTWENQHYYMYEFPTHEGGVSLPFTQLWATETQADSIYTYTETHYRKLDTMLVKPYKTFTKVKTGRNGAFIMQSAARFEYDTITVRNYPDANSRRYLGREISEQRVRTLKPSDTSQTLLITKTNYLHLAQKDTVLNVRSRRWDKFAVLAEFHRQNAIASQNGEELVWEEVMGCLPGFDTVETTRLLRMPALYNLGMRSVVTDASGIILTGEAALYATTYKQDDTSSIYRGALLADSLIGHGGSAILQNSYTYWGGRTGHYKSLRRTETDALGGLTRYEYDYGCPELSNSGLMVCNDNSKKSAVLYGRRGIGEYESPLKTIQYTRAFALGGMPITTPHSSTVERTYYDQIAGSVDENGWYSRYDYDKNGRLRTAWLPKDFPGDSLYTEHWTGALEVPMSGFTRYQYMSDTIFCSTPPPGSFIGPPSGPHVEPDFLRLIAAKPPTQNPCGIGSGTPMPAPPIANGISKGGNDKPLTTANTKHPYHDERIKRGYFTASTSKPIREAISLSKARLRLHITKVLGSCVNFTVRVLRPDIAYTPNQVPQYPDTLFVKTYVLNCSGVFVPSQNGSALSTGETASSKRDTPKPLSGSGSSPLPYELLVVNLDTIASALLSSPWEVEIATSTAGAEVEVVNDGTDWQPTLLLEGMFDRVYELSDYSLHYDIADRWADSLNTTVWAKIDDSLHTANAVGLGSTPVDNSRYIKIKNRFGADYRVLTGLETKTKNGVVWTDSVVTTYTGMGQRLKITDQLGDTASMVYDAQGRTRYTYNADGTRIEMRHAIGTPSSLIYNLGSDQDFYGLCRRALSIEEDGQVKAQFYDAFGRLRRESVMFLDTNTDLYPGSFITKYEYDLLGRLTTVVNPAGDTTRYWYDTYGRIKYKHQPDMGYTSYAYDKLGNTRFIQTQHQADSALVTFQEYDDLGRTTLVGEARLGGEPGGGGHDIANPKKGKHDGVLSFPPHPTINLNRLTDQLDPNILHDDNNSGIVTANKTVQLPWLVALPTFWTMNQLEQAPCKPIPQDPNQPTGAILRHPVAYYTDAVLPLATQSDFEHIARYPQNARTVINYDDLPQTGGSVWFYFPTRDKWDALAPTGKVRNQRGREAAVAYRTHAGEPYHFTVMSYDERGRVEAVLHYTENIGFDAVYYTYNSLNLPITVRVADPLRQYATWYGYNSNGRIDSIWTQLSTVAGGLGITNPDYPAPITKPTQPDIVYNYTKRWQIDTISYPPVNTVVSYKYNARRFLDSMVAMQGGSTKLFVQKLQYDVTGQITLQTSRHNTQTVDQFQEYIYDDVGRLIYWNLDTNSQWTVFGERYHYDLVGNRTMLVNYLQDSGRTRSYKYTDPVGRNRLMSVQFQSLYQIDTTKFLYTSDGSVRYRERRKGNALTMENLVYENILGRVKRYTRWDGGAVGGFGQLQEWRYRYNPSGDREQKRVYSSPYNKTWTYYQLGGDGKQLAVFKGIETDNTSCGSGLNNVYLWASEYLTYGDGATHVMTSRPIDDFNGLKEYKIQDHLGSTRLIIAQGGSVTGRYDYKPFGGIFWQSGATPRLSWIDREEDAESSLEELGARKYDEEIGRFLSIDPRWEDQHAYSPYHYAANNPITNKDPDGDIFDTILDVGFIVYDVVDIGISIAKGEGVSKEQALSLTADVVSAAIPGLTGGGAMVKAAMHADDAVKVVKTAVKAEKAAVKTEKAISTARKVEKAAVRASETASTTKRVEKGVSKIPATRNGHLAGKTHPKTGVPFDKKGFPDFSKNLYKGGKNDVRIKPTGNRTKDFAAANKAAGYKSTPKGYTWHHHQTTGRMQLVKTDVHKNTGHTGGFSLWKLP